MLGTSASVDLSLITVHPTANRMYIFKLLLNRRRSLSMWFASRNLLNFFQLDQVIESRSGATAYNFTEFVHHILSLSGLNNIPYTEELLETIWRSELYMLCTEASAIELGELNGYKRNHDLVPPERLEDAGVRHHAPGVRSSHRANSCFPVSMKAIRVGQLRSVNLLDISQLQWNMYACNWTDTILSNDRPLLLSRINYASSEIIISREINHVGGWALIDRNGFRIPEVSPENISFAAFRSKLCKWMYR